MSGAAVVPTDAATGDRLRVVQVTFRADEQRRAPYDLLRVWHTLPAVASGTARAGVEVAVVQAAHVDRTIARDGVDFHFVDDAGAVPVRVLGGLRHRRRPSRLIDRVAELAPDVVHVRGLDLPLAVRQLADALPGVPVLAQDFGTVPPTDWRRRAWRWAYRPLAGVAFTARQQAAPYMASGTLRDDVPVFEVVGGSSAFTPGDREAARAATRMHGAPCVLWTSHLDANKDPLTALAAFELAALQLPDARLWCCYGRAPLLHAVRARIATSPVLRDRVTLLGARPHEELELRFRAADFLLQTSHREASGFSVLEAMACGTVPLVTDIPASRRIVGDVGALTPVGDAAALAEALVDWWARDGGTVRRAARERFERSLTYDAIGRDLRAAYAALATGAGR